MSQILFVFREQMLCHLQYVVYLEQLLGFLLSDFCRHLMEFFQTFLPSHVF